MRCACMQEYAKARGKYIIDEGIMKIMQKHAVVMHPLPRVDEVGACAMCAQTGLPPGGEDGAWDGV